MPVRRSSVSPKGAQAHARLGFAGSGKPELVGHPLPHRVVASGQPPGQVGVEALHPPAGAAHPARGSGAMVLG